MWEMSQISQNIVKTENIELSNKIGFRANISNR